MKRRIAAVLTTATLLVAGSVLPAAATSQPARSKRSSAGTYLSVRVTPNPVVLSRHGASVGVRAYFGAYATSAYATITDPARHSSVVRLRLVGGYPNYGLWRGAARLSDSARPGIWKITTHVATFGTWAAGPHGRFTVQQRIVASLNISPRRVKAGQTVTLTGHVSAWSTSGHVIALAGRRVGFSYLMRAAGARWVRLGSVWTDHNGNFHYRFVVVRSGAIRAVVAGGGLFAGVTTSKVAITVR